MPKRTYIVLFVAATFLVSVGAQSGAIKPDFTGLKPNPKGTSGPLPPVIWELPKGTPRTVPENAEAPVQVMINAKVVEYETTVGMETGLSAYFAKIGANGGIGSASTGGGIKTADITFPSSTTSGISVFLDRFHLGDGGVEAVLQALASENRLTILSHPNVNVMVGSPIPSEIKIVNRVPYEEPSVIGATAIQSTNFRETGVSLKVSVPQVIDDDGNWATTDDTYLMLNVDAEVNEEGQRLNVALAAQNNGASNFIQVPELVTRSIQTTLWVRSGQVLIMGGLYRNTKNKSLSTLPWLTQGENLALGLAQRALPVEGLSSPVSATLGNRSVSRDRRELVFLIKAEVWQPSHTIHGFSDENKKTEKKKASPGKMINDLIEGISQIPQGIAGSIKKESGGIGGKGLGGD